VISQAKQQTGVRDEKAYEEYFNSLAEGEEALSFFRVRPGSF
jgi:hypothetical protein